jgi:hypothetical protein
MFKVRYDSCAECENHSSLIVRLTTISFQVCRTALATHAIILFTTHTLIL